jgi:phage terminase large subunit
MQNNSPIEIDFKFNATKVFKDTWNATQSGKYKLIEQNGSSRSSKTWSDFQVLFLDLYKNPMLTATILRDTQKSCREIVETDWIKWLSDPMGRKMQLQKKQITLGEFDAFIRAENLLQFFVRNKTNHTWTFKHNNSFIRFTGLDDENDAMGMTQDICWINEPYNFSHEVYKQLSQRTSKYIIFDWNPKQSHWVDIERLKANTITLKSTFRDNPYCPHESRKQILSYQPVEKCLLVVEGKLTLKEALIYNATENPQKFARPLIKELVRCRINEATKSSSLYHWLVYGEGEKAEKPNRIFKNWKIIKDELFDNLPYPLYYATDFGLSACTAMIACKFDGDRTFFFKELLYKPMNLMEGTLVQEFEKLKIDKNKENICDSGNEINTSESAKLRNAGYNIVSAKKGAGSVNGGIESLQKAQAVYTESSVNIEMEYENYSWRIWQGIQLDEPEQTSEDHLMDCCRMFVMWYVRTRRITF